MGINLKKIAKQNRIRNGEELNKKATKNNIIHAFIASQLKGQVNKTPKKDKDGNVHWYWGLIEWFDENNQIKDEFFR